MWLGKRRLRGSVIWLGPTSARACCVVPSWVAAQGLSRGWSASQTVAPLVLERRITFVRTLDAATRSNAIDQGCGGDAPSCCSVVFAAQQVDIRPTRPCRAVGCCRRNCRPGCNLHPVL